ncbi:LysR family transcriptional regulator [Mycetocola lacteus]|uniref:LysR family transcriptional regulator n=1 Tax=Mycetocola lacteus TaxID=76637 RepID=A0A3L7AU50_9MICO|nr:LysR family transcriptional regulator [Mycetocola lacteus]RLP82902.1 LysR family transcriptional regulator [Mycetocola lacteus]
MDLRQLEFFLAVAAEENFTRAAERSFVSQPGLSSSIRALERELGVSLFTRGRGGATLTASGDAFRPRAALLLGEARRAQEALLRAASASPRTTRIGAEQCLGDFVDLVDLITAFGSAHPHTSMHFTQASTQSLHSQLDTGEIDLALLANGLTEEVSATSIPLRRESFVLLGPEGHPLATRESLRPEELDGVATIDFADTWAARRILDEAWARRGITRQSVMTLEDVHMLIRLVARGGGVAIVPESMAAKLEAAELPRAIIEDDSLGWEIRLVLSDTADETARAFAETFVGTPQIETTRGELAAALGR